jgi:uncharacterized protein (TIGR03000 family)
MGGAGGYIGRPRALFLGGYDRSWPRPGFRRDWGDGYYYSDGYRSYYYDPYTADYPRDPAVDVNAVTLRMHVPGDARIWIESEATSQSGPDRYYMSPSLAPGREYTYHIRVQWNENGKTVERNREVKVQAGDRIDLNVTK